jgi:hypothetical protein
VSDGLPHHQGAIDRGDPTLLALESASGTALGTAGGRGGMLGELAHLPGLDPAAELSPQFVGAGLDHRVMRETDEGALGAVEGHGDLRGLAQELVEFVLECGRRPIHGSTPSLSRSGPPELPRAALYNEKPAFSY